MSDETTEDHASLTAAVLSRYGAPSVWEPPGYAQAVCVQAPRRWLFLAGQVARDAAGEPYPVGDFAGQARSTIDAVLALQAVHGAGAGDIVKLTVYLTDIANAAVLRPLNRAAFGSRLPPITVMAVAALAHPDWLIEIEAVAAL